MSRTFIGWSGVLVIALVAANGAVYRSVFAPDELQVSVLPVGTAVAYVLEIRGQAVLVDSGGDAGVLRALGQTLPPWRRTLAALILTVPTRDSPVSAHAVRERYRVERIFGFGSPSLPYGAELAFAGAHIIVTTPHHITIKKGTTVLTASSSTPAGTYRIK